MEQTALRSEVLESSKLIDGGHMRLGISASIPRQLSKLALALFVLPLALDIFESNVQAQIACGDVSGTVSDSSGAVVPAASVIVRNALTGIQRKTETNAEGFYAFPSVPVGQYDLDVAHTGFKPYRRSGIAIDVNTKLQADVSLEIGGQNEEVTVRANAVQVETENTQMGDVIPGEVITAVALNGRSFTDLLALQPGIVPTSTQLPDSIVMAGATVAIQPSGNLNPGNQSISGQREDANGFLVNGGDVKEEMNGGTSIVPNLDSIAELRVLTSNFDAEFGNYAGGIVNVITKSGTSHFHGDAFEFLRNTALDARNYFSPTRESYQQSQFGGTIGGPITKSKKLFFFADYQGTRTNDGIDTGLIPVPSLADRTGNLADQGKTLIGAVSGPYNAGLLSQSLGYPVSANEPYYTSNCSTPTECVFPNAVIPQSVWSSPANHLLQYIPAPNVGSSLFSATVNEKVRDDKTGLRIDLATSRWGQLSAYYFFDDYYVNNPFPTGQGGASVPGFAGVNLGRSQLLNLSDTKTWGSSTVNELHFSYMRDSNNVGKPAGGVGPSLASQGFVVGSGPQNQGIDVLAPKIEGIENLVFNSFVMGVPVTNLAQANNTIVVNDTVSQVLGNHTLKAGAELSFEQVNVNPDATFNGTFTFDGSETGLDFADFLIGTPFQFTQSDSRQYYPRHKYLGAFVQDSWHVTSALTLNYGLRMELMQYWSEKYNQIPTFIVGEQSVAYPTAPLSLVYPTDPGVPPTLVPESIRYAPRVGLAYSPRAVNGLFGKIMGAPGTTSIRASYGIFSTVIQGNSIAFDEPQPPYGLSYTSPGPPLFAKPYVTAATGAFTGNPYPLSFPSFYATASHPNPSINFVPFEPQNGMTAPPPTNTYPYTENYFVSIERQLMANSVLSVSYVGSQAHHILAVYPANPGNPALCQALDQPGVLVNGEFCGPGGESTPYTLAKPLQFGGTSYAAGQTIQGTRIGLGHNFGNDDYEASVGNSTYNSLQVSLKHTSSRLTLSLSYTYSKSKDQGSSLGDPLDPFDLRATRALSAWDLTHDFVATGEYHVPSVALFKRERYLTQGWSISAITRAATGFPVTMDVDKDNSLQGSYPNGVNNHLLDMPAYTGGSLNLNHNPRNGRSYFDTANFSDNALGTVGFSRRFFHGPGMFNTDAVLLRTFPMGESTAFQFRLEAFNVFNHTQFFGPAAVNGDVDSSTFGDVVKAAPPRLVQLALKFTF